MAADTKPTDDELMQRVQGGDAGAFEDLVGRYRAAPRAFADRMTGDGAAAEDIVQETFVRVYEERGEYIAMGHFRAWIYTISRNLCHDRFREPTLLSFDPDMPLALLVGVASIDGRSWEPASDADRLDQVGRAAKGLPDAMWEAVELKYYHGLKIREIAQVLDCPPGTGKSRLHYALKQMARTLSAGQPEA